MNNFQLYENMDMPDPHFPVKVLEYTHTADTIPFVTHWHEHLELIYVKEGTGRVECSQIPYAVKPGDLIVVNSNELHQGESTSDRFSYYCIIIDIAFLLGQGNPTRCNHYASQITRNLVLFNNLITGDPSVTKTIHGIVSEYTEKRQGYELEILSRICHLIVLLYRGNLQRVITEKEYALKARNMERFTSVLQYIEAHYPEKITPAQCARRLNITVSHFCHLFKLITGKSLSLYIQYIRLKKAETLLKNTDLSITEIAHSVGFSDGAYFSRRFKDHAQLSPLDFRKLPDPPERCLNSVL